MGVDGVLAKLRQELKSGTYRPLPARERLIPAQPARENHPCLPSAF